MTDLQNNFMQDLSDRFVKQTDGVSIEIPSEQKDTLIEEGQKDYGLTKEEAEEVINAIIEKKPLEAAVKGSYMQLKSSKQRESILTRLKSVVVDLDSILGYQAKLNPDVSDKLQSAVSLLYPALETLSIIEF
jgi:hypothetical protein